jgi:hypothetical protein
MNAATGKERTSLFYLALGWMKRRPTRSTYIMLRLMPELDESG